MEELSCQIIIHERANMSSYAYLEIDMTKEKFPIYIKGHIVAGNLLFRLFSAFENFCQGLLLDDMEGRDKIIDFISKSPNICKFSNAFYGGSWNYSITDYEKFRIENSELNWDKAKFIAVIEKLNQKWTDINIFLIEASNLLEYFSTNEIKEMWWYVPNETEVELKALIEIVEFAKNHNAKKMRIQFI